MTKSRLLILCGLMLVLVGAAWYRWSNQATHPATRAGRRLYDGDRPREHTAFETAAYWHPSLQIRSDIAICHGADDDLPRRIEQWKAQGYIPHFMTGASWGQYQDYLDGRFDGVRHRDEVQTDRDGKAILGGENIPYICPSDDYVKYLRQLVERAVDAGAAAIHLEEPEFWAKAGYGEVFRRRWESAYGEGWVPPHSSTDARYRASMLEYDLYRRTLEQVFDAVRAENARTGRQVKRYVATYSVLDCARRGVITPGSGLTRVGADGYIVGCSAAAASMSSVYRGVRRARTFETAFLEYGATIAALRPGGGDIWLRNDPMGGGDDCSWREYRSTWESTLTAALLWPGVHRYEVIPWPERILVGQHPTVDRSRRGPGDRAVKMSIPPAYATELMTVANALDDMDQPDVAWDCGTPGIGVLVSDSIMFQRGDPSPSDPDLGSFYGLALPLLKHGIPVEPVSLEHAAAGALGPYKVLLMTYEGMKPMSAAAHAALAAWVSRGGVLVFLGDDSDPYNAARSWWNDPAQKMAYRSPREHLFAELGLSKGVGAGSHACGVGRLIWDVSSPAGLSGRGDGAATVRALARGACASAGLSWRETNYLSLRRGPYVVAAGLDESLDGGPHVLRGRFLDLLDARLQALGEVELVPGSRRLLLDLDRVRQSGPAVLASACKVLGARSTPDGAFRFYAEGPDKIEAVIRVALPGPPTRVELDGSPIHPKSWTWDPWSRSLLLRFPNAADGHDVTMRYHADRPEPARERTAFQTSAPWHPSLQIRSDIAICYGAGDDLPRRIEQWKAQGYIPHFMTGASWGQYQDYLDGRFDGVRHRDEVQTDRDGAAVLHHDDIPYICPGDDYTKYLCGLVKRAMDAGAAAIHLEEPEFWARAGYGEAFRRQWRSAYGEDWVPPHSSPDAQYRASMLKYDLYRRSLKGVFDFVKAENARTGGQVKCYVATHSPINYARWGIVSPGSSLIPAGAEGLIAQVWTGTARAPNVYQGRRRARTFETAFLEYGSMVSLARAGDCALWFLSDPVEDNPDHSWEYYRTNWESTLTAALLWPGVHRYEVMPWPERILVGRHPTVDRSRRRPGEVVEMEPIPPAYATELMTVANALNDMDQPDVAWDCGTPGIGVLVSDSIMFQRGDPSPSDADLGSFYGLALPLLKHGIPVEPVSLDGAAGGALVPYKVLLMTYEGMKPMSAAAHAALAAWVSRGGVLVFLGDDSDPYNAARSWWNDAAHGMAYRSPREHLFAELGLSKGVGAGSHACGVGRLIWDVSSPAGLSGRGDGAATVRALARGACASAGLSWRETNYLSLRRGPYVVAAGLDESLDGGPHVLRGRFLDLLDAKLAVRESVALEPRSRHLLLDLDRARPSGPAVLASACKVVGAEKGPDGAFRFYAEGPDKTEAAVRVVLPEDPTEVTIDGQHLDINFYKWDPGTRTLLLRFPNASSGHQLSIR